MVGVWAMEETSDTVTKQESLEQPVCLKCLHPFSQGTHYCNKCGDAVGQLTPYIPFVNISYNYSVFGNMWKRIWREGDKSWYVIVFYWILIFLFVPWLILCLPVELFSRGKSLLSTRSIALCTMGLSIAIMFYTTNYYSYYQFANMEYIELDGNREDLSYEDWVERFIDDSVSLKAPPDEGSLGGCEEKIQE
jgi:hypothetical protein